MCYKNIKYIIALLPFFVLADTGMIEESEDFIPKNSMYKVLERAYKSQENTVPTFDSFYRVGETDTQKCMLVEKSNPDEAKDINVNLFSRYYGERGPLFPARRVEKIIVQNKPSFSQFDQIEMEVTQDLFKSSYKLNSNNQETITFRENAEEELIYFKVKGKKSGNKINSYGYCYEME